MKKICLIVSCLLLGSILSYGQLDVSAGVSKYNIRNSGIGLCSVASYKNFYLDISCNLKGHARLVQDSGSSTKSQDTFVLLINTGYNIQVAKKWFLLPVIGIGWKSDIYQNHFGSYNTFSYENTKSFINAGLSAKFFINGDFGLIIGTGYPEEAKIGIVYRLWD